MFKRKPNPQAVEPASEGKKKPNWFKISIIANVVVLVVLVVGLASLEIIHQSDTNPAFCATCHVMQPNVDSYLNSNNLDAVHAQANVECKECHFAYGLKEEIVSGLNFVVGNYEVKSDGTLPKRRFSQDLCLECHISYDHVAEKTAHLARNPHDSHYGQMACSTCHVAHGEQIDYCGQCHDNGGQRIIGADEPKAQK